MAASIACMVFTVFNLFFTAYHISDAHIGQNHDEVLVECEVCIIGSGVFLTSPPVDYAYTAKLFHLISDDYRPVVLSATAFARQFARAPPFFTIFSL
ncbi:hypothetical protein [Kordiimonas sp. SCSIO 12610]|uniref:hypothetical protein n=1 Tax=Kordiimonas sp. SCSIO 12610 TaxID=2829597 RepID=UPI00210C2649|nr:hypothetical protein [Kordiimonas sp. SCSIO 12610]UTW56026.1 hypothetical protein KFF44_03790 [Kordiimonas sp. SCSIO 12610]